MEGKRDKQSFRPSNPLFEIGKQKKQVLFAMVLYNTTITVRAFVRENKKT